ncbi:MAG: response regulator [Candidatus Kapaibacteriota bacterium]
MRILVVEDLLVMRRLIVNTLRSIGYEDLLQASNGEEALELIFNPDSKIEFVLTDWIMPVMDGLTLVKFIRTNPDTADLPIIMLTSMNEKDNLIEAIKYKVNDYIIKPFTPKLLKDKIEHVLKIKKLKSTNKEEYK